MGYLKGVGRIYQQTVIDTFSSVTFAKLYTAKIPVTAADLLNDRVIPFFESQGIPVLRVLTDRGTEFCGTPDKHPYELFLQLNDIEHTKTRAKSPQTNGICERVHQTILNEFYNVAFRKKLYPNLDTLQIDLDEYMGSTMKNGPIRASAVSAGPRCRPSRMGRSSLRRKTWKRS